MSKVPEEYYVNAKKYREMFGSTFPYLYFDDMLTEEEIVEIVKKCVAAGKDAYKMGYAEFPEDDEDF